MNFSESLQILIPSVATLAAFISLALYLFKDFSRFNKKFRFDYFFGIFSALGFITTLLYFVSSINPKSQDNEIINQIKRLDEAKQSLTLLTKYIDEQKKSIIETEKTVKSLKEEQSKLKPLVESDKKIVEDILSIHAERNKINIWIDRLLAFILGVLSSLVAAFIFRKIEMKNNILGNTLARVK